MYPDLKKFLSRDYFGRPDSSLSCFSAPQGLFPPAGFISILLFFSTGIIFSQPDASLSSSFSPQGLFLADRMHLYLPLLLHKDYFTRPDASLAGSFVPQGLFPPARCIPSFLFFTIGIISSQSDTSPIAENISARSFHQLPILLSDQLCDKLDVICLQITKRILIFSFFEIN